MPTDTAPGFTRTIEIFPAYDKRHPDPRQNYGIHGVEMRFILKGEKGATTFTLYTNWHLPHVTREHDAMLLAKASEGRLDHVDVRVFCHPQPADRGYHSPAPMYEGQSPIEGRCPILDGRPCYYDGSGLNASTVYDALLAEGSEGVWRELEYYYNDVFETPMEDRTFEGAELGAKIQALLKDPEPG